jgi:hypothetical protein
MSSRQGMRDGLHQSFLKVSSTLFILHSYSHIGFVSEIQRRVESGYQISRSSNGLPLFPTIDLSQEACEVIKTVIEGYLVHVWGKLA